MADPARSIALGCDRPYDDGPTYTGSDPALRATYGILHDLSARLGPLNYAASGSKLLTGCEVMAGEANDR